MQTVVSMQGCTKSASHKEKALDAASVGGQSQVSASTKKR